MAHLQNYIFLMVDILVYGWFSRLMDLFRYKIRQNNFNSQK